MRIGGSNVNGNLKALIGILSENERRTPLTPDHILELRELNPRFKFIVEPSTQRVFSDKEYEDAGAEISNDLSRCSLILGLKRIPPNRILAGKTYMCFAHVNKAQKDSMSMLDEFLRKNSRLIDYERILDIKQPSTNNPTTQQEPMLVRTLQFGRFAAISGTIEFLSGFGKFLLTHSLNTPFLNIACSSSQFDISHAIQQIELTGEQIKQQHLPKQIRPLIFGITGEGRCAIGTFSVLSHLPIKQVSPDELKDLVENPDDPEHATTIYICSFDLEHTVTLSENPSKVFQKQHFIDNPHEYSPTFESKYLPFLSCIFNNSYWDYRFPRLITTDGINELANSNQLRLLGIADISGEIEGTIEFLTRKPSQDKTFFVYDAHNMNSIYDPIVYSPNHILYMTHDSLPSLLARDSSQEFSNGLKNYIANVVGSRIDKPLDQSGLSETIQRAVITNNGKMAPEYQYIDDIRRSNEDQSTLELNARFKEISKRVHSYSQLKIEGHIFDTGAINQILNLCNTNNIKYQITDVQTGKQKSDPSHLIIQLFGSNQESMIQTLTEIETISKQSSLSINESRSGNHVNSLSS